jgi:signal peptidase I
MGSFFKVVLWGGFVLFVIGVVLRFFFVELAVVGHDGMAPTLVAGELVAVWRYAEPEIGDVFICQHPTQSGKHVLGRVMAKPGYVIRLNEHGQITVGNDAIPLSNKGVQRFYDSQLKQIVRMRWGVVEFGYTTHEYFSREGMAFTMRPAKVTRGIYLLSDNRTSRGHDSRYYGEVDPEACIGQVFMRLKPAPPKGDDIDHGWMEIIK